MSDIYLDIDEYIWLAEYQQGNVNVGGLVFDDLIEDILDVGLDAYIVWVDLIESSMGLADSIDQPYHHPLINESLVLREVFGVPTRVRQSVLNVIMNAPVVPIMVSHMHLDVLHGPDIYWEEVASELQAQSSYVNAVPYYWEWVYESLDIDMTEPQPEPPIYLAMYFLNNDLVNMRHDVEQEYFFNSKCLESFFLWDGIVWGWNHLVDSPLVNTDFIQEIIGKVADDYLYLEEASVPLIKVLHLIDDRIFVFDAVVDEKYYLLAAEDTIDVGDVIGEIFGQLVHENLTFQGIAVSGLIRYISAIDAIHAADASLSERYYLLLADETVEMTDGVITFLSLNTKAEDKFNTGATADTMGIIGALASESLTFTDLDTYIHGLLIEEGLALGDVGLSLWVFNVLVASGCNVSDIIG